MRVASWCLSVTLGLDSNLLLLAVSLAATDSINPCTLYLYTILLLASSVSGAMAGARTGFKHVVLVGLAFTLSVMLGYTLLGMGVVVVLPGLSKALLLTVGVGFGAWTIYSGMKGEEKTICREGVEIVCQERMARLLTKASKSVILSGMLGLLATFTLLPCSAGPYIVFLGMISNMSLIESLPLLLLYNAIFVFPLLAILLLIAFGMSGRRAQDFILKNHNKLSILSGLLLIAVVVYIAL